MGRNGLLFLLGGNPRTSEDGMKAIQPFDIGKSTDKPPEPKKKQSAWGPVWEAARKLSKNDWLPITVQTIGEANSLYLSAQTHRTLRLETRRRGRTVWIRLVGLIVVK